jgi:hypothetical protein
MLFTFFVSPATRSLGPHGALFTAELMERRMGTFMAAVGGITVLSGLGLYWVFTQGLSPDIATHGAGLALGIGGLCGVIAVVIGGAILGKTAERIGILARETTQLPEGEARSNAMETIAKLQHKMAVTSRCDVVLLLTALLLMSAAHAL